MRMLNTKAAEALWLIDLTDHEDPTPVFVHPAVDVGAPSSRRTADCSAWST